MANKRVAGGRTRGEAAAPSIRALIFDIGRVIIRLDIKRAMGDLNLPSKASPEDVWQAIEGHPLWRDWQEGRVAPRAWQSHLSSRLGFDISFEDFCTVWNRVLDPATLLPDSLFAKLSRRYKLALVSNTDPIHVAHMESRFDFIQRFPVRIYSCAVGASKPGSAIFHRALEACSVKPAEAVFIDDIEPFVAAARRLGMHGIRFHSTEQLAADLQLMGVLND